MLEDGVSVSMLQIFEMYPSAESARIYLEHHRWGSNVVCPHCGCDERITVRKGKTSMLLPLP